MGVFLQICILHENAHPALCKISFVIASRPNILLAHSSFETYSYLVPQ